MAVVTDTTLVGLTLVKLNGIYHVDFVNARFSLKRVVNQPVTGGGVRASTGAEIPTGTMDEVIPRTKGLNWRVLRNFSLVVLDKEGKTELAVVEGCNWNGIDGSFDLGGASARKSFGWAGTTPVLW